MIHATTIRRPDIIKREFERLTDRETLLLRIRMAEEHASTLGDSLDSLFELTKAGKPCELRYPDGTVIIIGPLAPTEATE